MNVTIITLGLLISLLGMSGLFSPAPLVRFVNSFWMRPRGLYMAVVIRLFFGAVLIIGAPQTRFPLAIQIIGILAMIGAFALPVIGFQRMQGLLRWWTTRSDNIIRIWSFAVLLFGFFLIHACL